MPHNIDGVAAPDEPGSRDHRCRRGPAAEGAVIRETSERCNHEILRLEPVVGRLYRRTSEPLTLSDGGEEVIIPAGTLVALDIRATNADRRAVGERPLVRLD